MELHCDEFTRYTSLAYSLGRFMQFVNFLCHIISFDNYYCLLHITYEIENCDFRRSTP
jgi:hypothetical protein